MGSIKANDCEMYWELVNRGIEVVAGLAPWINLLRDEGCEIDYDCECDVVVNIRDFEKLGCGRCCYAIDSVGFSIDAPVLEGVPAIKLEIIKNLINVDKSIIEKMLNCIEHRRGLGGDF